MENEDQEVSDYGGNLSSASDELEDHYLSRRVSLVI